METNPTPKRPKFLLVWMILSQLIAAGSLVFWLVMAGLSVMAFDAGVTAEAWTFVIVVWSYPIFPLIMVIGSWIAYARRKHKLAAVLSGLSFAPMMILALVLLIGNAAWFLQN